MRLDVLLARNAGWSRTAARAAIAEGRVRIAGASSRIRGTTSRRQSCRSPSTVDEAELLLYDRVSLMLNKPTGA